MIYYIKIHYAPSVNKANKIILKGLTLEEAQEHCLRVDTCEEGEWFDGYYKEEEK